MAKCLICESTIEPFIDFGKMPIANGFLEPQHYKDEPRFSLKVALCEKCGMVQLTEQVDREKMFNDQYAFFSSTSTRMAEHFKEFAADISKKYLTGNDPFVVEMGSNDGIMLQNFAKNKVRHLGIEPSGNVADVARQRGINTISEFFDEALAEKIKAQYGQADAFLSANVMCHIPYLHSIAKGIKALLKPKGVLAFEDPYLGDIVEKTSYDQIYDEHAFYFSVGSVQNFFKQHGLELFDIAHQETHGGSMRYYLSHTGAYPISQAVKDQSKKEEEVWQLKNPKTYETLRKNIERSREQLVNLLSELKKEGKRVVGYGATSKSTTVINYCNLNSDLIQFISDTTPIKQGKYSPGAHIPVRPYQEFSDKYPDYALLFAWNHATEIMAKEKQFKNAGGKWIVYVPEVKIFS